LTCIKISLNRVQEVESLNKPMALPMQPEPSVESP